jgi:alanine dehydrogenase
MSTLILKKEDIKNLLDMREVIDAVEDAFKFLGQNKVSMPPKSYLVVDTGDFRAMPASIPDAVGIKWVNVHLENKVKGIPSIMAVLIYNDPETGYPLAIMDATEITAFRTAAASAIASKHLAINNPQTLGIIGAGYQAKPHIAAHLEIFNLQQIKVYDIVKESIDKLILSFQNYPIKECPLQDTVASDIVCTLTPSRTPVIKREWIKSGTHINAVGADAKGKQELETSILENSIVFVDDLMQASTAGEINVPVSNGKFSIKQVYAPISDVIIGKKKGRVNKDQITIFDSTGIAIEDIAIAKVIYEKAKKKKCYLSIDLV